MKKVQTPGGTLSYQVLGKGPPLVMLRGLGRTVRHWAGYEQEMAKKFRVLVTDLRGMGESERKHGIFDTVWNYADDLALVMDAAGMTSAHVMGVSLGGMATLAMGLRYPERTQSIIAINSSIGGQNLQRITIDASLFLLKGLVTRSTSLQPILVDLLVGKECSEKRRSELAQAYDVIAQDQGLFAGTVVKQLLAAVRFAPGKYLKDLKVPTFVIYGSEDRFVPIRNSQNLAKLIPHAKIFVIPGAGHEISADKGPELAKAVETWVADISN